MEDYGLALKLLRIHFKYTQREVADKVGVSHHAVSKWENGINQPDIHTLREICALYGITTEHFFRIAAGEPIEDVLQKKTREEGRTIGEEIPSTKGAGASSPPIVIIKWWWILLAFVAVALLTLGIVTLMTGLEGDTEGANSGQEEPPIISEKGDLATSGVISSRAPENYGVENIYAIQNEIVADGSDASLMGIFSCFDGESYQENQIWTWSVLSLEDFFGEPYNLQDNRLVYDVKTENCGIFSSFIVVDSKGRRSAEITFAFNEPYLTYPGITFEELDDGWTRVFLDFNIAYPSDMDILQDAVEIFIMFTNQYCENPDEDSIFYMDNMSLLPISLKEDDENVAIA